MFPSSMILLSALLVSSGVVNAEESHLDFNYQLLARDWVDRPDSYCGSTEQSPIDLNGHYMQFPTNFMPTIQLPTISGVSVINTGENINIDFDIIIDNESHLEVFSPVNSSFTDLYGTYTGTGVSPPSRNRNLRGSSRSGSRDQKKKSKKHHHRPSKGSRSVSRDQNIRASRQSEDEDLAMIEAASLKTEEVMMSESNAGILGDIHWHVPSEHTVNGRLAAAEMHLVHFVVRPGDDSCQFEYKGEQACIVVIGILFDLVYDGADEMSHGDDNHRTNLLDFLGPLPAFGDNSSSVVVDGSFDLNNVLPSNNNSTTSKIWTYRGSLTTPECNENVTWMVVQEPHPIGWSQWSELRNAIVNEELGDLNARPPQSRNDRVVFEGTFR